MIASLLGSFVRRPAADPAALYWLHIEQAGLDDDTASLGEVAELVDEAFGTTPCGAAPKTEATVPASPPAEVPTPPTMEELTANLLSEVELAAIVRKQFRPALCNRNINGDYAVQVKVALSHPGEYYVLRLTNGRITGTIAVEEAYEKTFVVKDAASVDLDFPVIGNESFAWKGSVYSVNGNMTGPEIVRSGLTLSWGGLPVTGSIAASYTTRYDLVDITVFGEDGEDGECRALCFYHGLVDEIDLQPPEVAAIDSMEIYRQPFCGEIQGAVPDDTDDQVTCYENITYEYRCTCSNKVAYLEHKKVAVTCPPGIKCQGGAHVCEALLGSRVILSGYVDCGEEGSIDLDNTLFRKETCCDNASPLPKCLIQYAVNPGGVKLDPVMEAAYRNKYGDRLRVIYVHPADGNCGTVKTRVVVRPKNCCVDVESLDWDPSYPVEVMDDDSSVTLGVVGGEAPFTWRVLSPGLHFLVNGRMAPVGQTASRTVALYSTDICGTVQVSVSDACGNILIKSIRAVDGQWLLYSNDLHLCSVSSVPATFVGVAFGVEYYEVVSGGLKMAMGLNHPSYESYDPIICDVCQQDCVDYQTEQGSVCGCLPDIHFCGSEGSGMPNICQCNTAYNGKGHYRWVC